jgi:hypothetical protein
VKSFCLRSVTRLPCLSVTMKTTLTSLVVARKVALVFELWSLEADELDATLEDCGCVAAVPEGDDWAMASAPKSAIEANRLIGNSNFDREDRIWIAIISGPKMDGLLLFDAAT